jgi:hypothetical protein
LPLKENVVKLTEAVVQPPTLIISRPDQIQTGPVGVSKRLAISGKDGTTQEIQMKNVKSITMKP